MPKEAERAAGALSRKVLTLGRDIAFLGNIKNLAKRRLMDDLLPICRRLGTIRTMIHIQVPE
jgi:aryl-alcohol dehydrogenase-like predicted oxidoreductase